MVLSWCLVVGCTAGEQAQWRTGFVYSDEFLKHVMAPGHPEKPERLDAIVAQLKRELWPKLVHIEPSPIELKWVETVHDRRYIDAVKRVSEAGGGLLDQGDTRACEHTYRVAMLAAGGALRAVDAVMAKKVRNAFCALRPPGHHALRRRAMGFCILNNVAIAAKYIQSRYELKKVLIIDWDVHHGNGTEAAFYDDPTVLYFSIHRGPFFYPGTGSADRRGEDKGLGTNINVPLPAGTSNDEWLEAFRDALPKAAKKFKPDFILISAGFDAYERDPLGGMRVTEQGYAEMTGIVLGLAGELCDGRVVAMLEGGYDTKGLARCVEAQLRVMMGQVAGGQ